ncbi:hypothetical protein I7636_01880 [Mycoplasma mycoides subsp. capri]|uniref:hypothetical protein n=1 Tax=Mycoplasma mycoides TaxID=2102 RepID=UPI00223EED4A|nr:hypothetical protein [Mycoplasma mycoides]QVK02334.1 hypothetical protein I7636_01880 [Mycoplasma mycoides subsp. capri]
MKKSLIILSSIIPVISTRIVISCTRSQLKDKTTDKNKNTNKKDNKNSKDNSNKTDLNNLDKNNSRKPEQKNKSESNHNSNKSQSNEIQKDQPTENNMSLDNLSEEKRRISNLLNDLTKIDQIKAIAEELIYKKQDLTSQKVKDEEWKKYQEKILSLFKEKKFDQVKEELLKLLKETIEIVSNKKSFEEKLKTYENIEINDQLKDGLLLEFKLFFETKFSINQEKETTLIISKFLEQIEQLISQKNHSELKNKLFELVDQIEQLEKNNKS